jgi:hypothetical protein
MKLRKLAALGQSGGFQPAKTRELAGNWKEKSPWLITMSCNIAVSLAHGQRDPGRRDGKENLPHNGSSGRKTAIDALERLGSSRKGTFVAPWLLSASILRVSVLALMVGGLNLQSAAQ